MNSNNYFPEAGFGTEQTRKYKSYFCMCIRPRNVKGTFMPASVAVRDITTASQSPCCTSCTRLKLKADEAHLQRSA